MDYFINSTGIITWIALVINATLFYVRYLAYWKKLEKPIENESSISSISALKEKLYLLKETLEDTQENLTLSKDTDAKIGHKPAESPFFWLQDSLGYDRRTHHYAAVVISGEIGDGLELPKLSEISQENGVDAETISGDAAYSAKGNLKTQVNKTVK